ncbi:MAG: HAD-IB family phosphatase [Chlorobi bacterium]|nr:HAD-IB family phosphatase [Chlorobiota bacterium]MCI0715104.1 HAD-IB family phosphatase [Chlorobiota bacterium]
MNDSKIKIYTDFDGTVTLTDVWMEIGKYFIKNKQKWDKIIKQFESQEIGARECFTRECELLEDLDIEKINEIIDNQELDPKFIEFYEFCLKNNIPLAILSEGMDYYIDRLLKKYNLEIEFYSNRIKFSEDKKRLEIEFPYSDSDCLNCGTSKRNILMNKTADEEISVFIGDGFSDSCVVNYADIVFAKKSLASYCWKNNITYFEFTDFGDIIKKLEKILLNKKPKHRQSAKFKRRDVFLRG